MVPWADRGWACPGSGTMSIFSNVPALRYPNFRNISTPPPRCFNPDGKTCGPRSFGARQFGHLRSSMSQISVLIQQYGLLVVFGAVLLSRVGLPVPAFPVLLTAAAMTSGSGRAATGLVLAGTAGGLI